MYARKISSLFAALALAALLAAFVLWPQAGARAFVQGLQLCGLRLLPSLFPFFVVGQLLMQCTGAETLAVFLRPFTRLGGFKQRCAPLLLLLSWVGGYAVCAQCVRRAVRDGQLSPQSAARFLTLGVCSGPGFVAGAIGGALGSVELGARLYLVQLAANLLCAIALRLWAKEALPTVSAPAGPQAAEESALDFPAALQSGVASCLTVCGCVLFFKMLAALLAAPWRAGPVALAALESVLEISGGSAALCRLPGPTSLYGLCALLSLYSCSVWLQLHSFLGGAVSLRPLLLTRPLHLMFSLSLLRLWLALQPVRPVGTPVYSSLSGRLLVEQKSRADIAFLIFLLCCVVARAFDVCLRQRFTSRRKSTIIK